MQVSVSGLEKGSDFVCENEEVQSSEEHHVAQRVSPTNSGLSLPLTRNEEAQNKSRLLGYTELSQKLSGIQHPAYVNRGETKRVLLNNGVQVFLRSSPVYKCSSVGFSVQSGDWQDPNGLSGMASFCTDLIATGPYNEGAYPLLDLISNHDGGVDSDLNSLSTEFYFELREGGIETLDALLATFGGFLQNLEWPKEYVEEYLEGTLESIEDMGVLDSERAPYVMRYLMSKEHPAHRVERQALSELPGIQPDQIYSWLKEHYTADKMTLVLTSPLPINELLDSAVKNFGSLPKSVSNKFESSSPILSEQTEAKWIHVKTDREQTLSICWELSPDFFAEGQNEPWKLAEHLLRDEGDCGLLAQLKREGLVLELVVKTKAYPTKQGVFSLNLSLTEKGVAEKEKVLERVYQTIQHFSRNPYLDHVLKNLQDAEYVQANSLDGALSPADSRGYTKALLQGKPLVSLPEGRHLDVHASKEVVQGFLASLSPKKGHYFICSPLEKGDCVEPHSQSSYAIKDVQTSLLESLEQVGSHSNIDFPLENTLISTDFSLLPSIQKKKDEGIERVTFDVVKSKEEMKVFFAPDTLLYQPFCDLRLKFHYLDYSVRSVAGTVVSDLFDLVLWKSYQALESKMQDFGGELAIEAKAEGLTLSLSSLRESVFKALPRALECMRLPELSDIEFEIFKEALRYNYETLGPNNPRKEAIDINCKVVDRDYVTISERMEALENLSQSEFETLVQERLKSLYCIGFLYGNVEKADGLQVAEVVSQSGFHVPSSRAPSSSYAEFSNSKPLLIHSDFGESDELSVRLTLQKARLASNKESVFMSYLSLFLEEFWQKNEGVESDIQPFFLLMKEGGHAYFHLSADSRDHGAQDILGYFDELMKNFVESLEQGQWEERFNNMKTRTLLTMNDRSRNFKEMGSRLYQLVSQGLKILTTTGLLRTSNYSEFVHFAQEFFSVEKNPRRLAVCVNDSSKAQIDSYEIVSLAEARTRCSYLRAT